MPLPRLLGLARKRAKLARRLFEVGPYHRRRQQFENGDRVGVMSLGPQQFGLMLGGQPIPG